MPRIAVEIPALPVLVPLTLVALVLTWWRLHRTGTLTGPRFAVGALACLYGAALLDAVFLPFAVDTGAAANLVPWWVYVQPVPLVTADPTGVLLNTALFVPLGVLLPLVTGMRSARRVVLTGAALSLAIEVTQFLADIVVSSGRVADVDDLIANTAGTSLGWLVFRVFVAIPAGARLVRAVGHPVASADGERSADVNDGRTRPPAPHLPEAPTSARVSP